MRALTPHTQLASVPPAGGTGAAFSTDCRPGVLVLAVAVCVSFHNGGNTDA